MADFKVEVPITLKGGNEGAKVGTQIGEKIANQLNKSLRAIGIGKTTGASPVGMSGVTKGLGSVATKLAVLGVAITAAVKFLSKASPYLKGILDIFGRAFLIFFRPFGDFLATLLRPLALLMMKAAVAFLKFSRTPGGKAATVAFTLAGGLAIAGLAAQVAGLLGIGTAAATATTKVALLSAALKTLAIVALGIGITITGFYLIKSGIEEGSLSKQIIGILATGLGIGLIGLTFLGPVGGLLAFTLGVGIGLIIKWKIEKQIYESDLAKRMANKEYSTATPVEEVYRGFSPTGGQGTSIGTMSTPPIPQEATNWTLDKNFKSGNGKVISITNNAHFTGNISSELDVDELMRKVNRMNEMELKQRGVI